MALGTGTMNMNAGGRPSAPTYQIDVSFTLDSNYQAGGTAGFAALVQAAAKAASTPLLVQITNDNIVGIKTLDAGGYVLAYDKANDKLKVYQVPAAGALGSAAPMVEASGNLSGVTARVVVECQ